MARSRWRAVLFDLDGTLLDSKQSIRDTMNSVLLERGLAPFSREELDHQIGRPLRVILAERSSDATALEAMTQRYRGLYSESGWVTARIFPGLEDLLRDLRRAGWRIGTVTSKAQREAEILLVDLGVADLFEVVVGDDDVRALKPDPAPVIEACRQLGVAPEDVVMVGDTSFDIASAKRAGAFAIGVLWGIHDAATLQAAGADVLVANKRVLWRTLTNSASRA